MIWPYFTYLRVQCLKLKLSQIKFKKNVSFWISKNIFLFYSNYTFIFEGMFTLPLDSRSLGFLYVVSANSSMPYTLENLMLNYLSKEENNFLTYILSHTLTQQLSMSVRQYCFQIPFLQAASKAVSWKQETIRAVGRKYVICLQSQVWLTCRNYKPIQKCSFSTSANCLQFQNFSGAIPLKSSFRDITGFLLYNRGSITNITLKKLKSNNLSMHKITVKLMNIKKIYI